MLHSEDSIEPELPLQKSKTHGGTMVLWKKHLDPFITIWTDDISPAFLPLLFTPPGIIASIHISIYLPTSGKNVEFTEEMAKLDICIRKMVDKHPDAAIFIRGDANVNHKDKVRTSLLHKLCQDWDLVEVDIQHPTYHHFLGDGSSDSQLDVLLYSKLYAEQLSKLICKLEHPLLTSHHDVLVSTFSVPKFCPPTPGANPLANRIQNSRVKIKWSVSGIEHYQTYLSDNLSRMRQNWLNSSSPASFSVLLQSTNAFLDFCARKSNKFFDLSSLPNQKSARKPLVVEKSEKRILRCFKAQKRLHGDPSRTKAQHREQYKKEKRRHNRLLRFLREKEGIIRDNTLDNLLSKNPAYAYKSIRQTRSQRQISQKVGELKVGGLTYYGETVPDGIFESIRRLKTDPVTFNNNPSFPNFEEDYQHILDICKSGTKIPQITREKSLKILNNIKKNVNDFYSITALHFLHAGKAGEDHFHFLLSTIIDNINLGGIKELNTIYACVHLKGPGKDRTSERSYRTISTCPLVAKAIDLYIRDISIKAWNDKQADTQYQGEGSSHELAILLLTEVVQHSLHVKKEPVFAIFLDAKSAFDRVVKEILVRNLFLAGTNAEALLYLDHRLSNRETFCEFDKQLMGPILDTKGLEQGGVSSSDKYKIYNNEQSQVAQESGLGVSIMGTTISAVALADDTVLVSNSIIFLKLLLYLTTQYCSKYCVELVPEKTKLIAFSTKENDPQVRFAKLTSELSLCGTRIPFSEEVEHLGVLRTARLGNATNVLERLKAHNHQLFSILPAGLALGHHANPAACIRVEQQYALPVLLSGLAALCLSKTEIRTVSTCYKNALQRLMKLYERTPDCAVYFLAGSLPGVALLHLRQLSLFLMVCHLKSDPLHTIAQNTLVCAKPTSHSWFQNIRDICILYCLPHPLTLLSFPPPKLSFTKLCRTKVLEYWHSKLSTEAKTLPSLEYLHPQFLSLTNPHPIWTSLDGNPYQAKAARIQAVFLTGRYRTERLCRFWSNNRAGICLLDTCKQSEISETLEHIIVHCPGLTETRRRLEVFTSKYIAALPLIKQITETYLGATDTKTIMQFLIDCSVLPLVISARQTYGPIIHHHLFRISRTWCRSLHRDRMKALGRFIKN